MKDGLVSVIVVTYNSSEFVCETLDSIFNQDYKQLELIVSDDCSKDNTLKVVSDWIEQHKSRFVNCEIISTPENLGIPANCNRGIKAAQGDWIKIFAGDDLLTPDCISINVNYMQSHYDCNVLFSRIKHFKVINGSKQFDTPSTVLDDKSFVDFFNKSDAKGQFYLLLKDGCFLDAPAVFYKTEFVKSHLYLEEYKYEEDYPMWLNLTNLGNKISLIPVFTVLYRRSNSLSSREYDYYSRGYMQTRSLLFWKDCFNYFKQENLHEAYEKYRKLLLRYELCEAFTQNKKSIINSIKMRIITYVIKYFAKYEL